MDIKKMIIIRIRTKAEVHPSFSTYVYLYITNRRGSKGETAPKKKQERKNRARQGLCPREAPGNGNILGMLLRLKQKKKRGNGERMPSRKGGMQRYRDRRWG